MTKLYQGSCHCESDEITRGLRCNCSICARKGAMMSPEPIPPDRFKIDAQDGALGLYQFGAKTAEHYFCKHCGIYTRCNYMRTDSTNSQNSKSK